MDFVPPHRSTATGGATLRTLAIVFAAAAIAVIVWTWPLITRIDDSVTTILPESYPACADQVLSVWIVNEAGRRLYTDPLHLFEANIFHPMRHTLAYSEAMLAAGAVVGPLRALTGNPILAFNLYYMAALLLSFAGTALLVNEITGSLRAALLAGLLFAFVGDRWAIPDHLPGQSVHCIPWVLYFWIRCLSSPSWQSHVGLAIAMAANFLHSVYYGLMLPVLLIPWAVVLLGSRRWPTRPWVTSTAVVSAVSVLSLVAYFPYLTIANEMDYRAIPLGGVSPSWYWSALTQPLAYVRILFSDVRLQAGASPVAALILLLAGFAAVVRESTSPPRTNEGVHALAMTAFLIGAVLMSLGRSIDVGVVIPLPFRLLDALPGFSSFRGTSRLLIFATFAAAVLMGVGIDVLLRRIRSRTLATALTAGLALVIAVDTRAFGKPWPISHFVGPGDVAPVYRWLATTPPDTAVLELPYGPWGDDAESMLLSTYHGRRVMNGYSARNPYFGEALLRFPDPIAIRALQDAGVSYVLAHADRLRSDPNAARRLAEMERRTDLAPRWMGSTLVLTIPHATPSSDLPPGQRLDPAAWRIEGSSPGAPLAADGNLATHWTTTVGKQGSLLRVDLGHEERIAGIVLRMGPHVAEYPRWYEVWTSLDGSEWQRAGESTPVTLPPFASYRRDHLDVRVPLEIDPTTARYVEIRVPHRDGPAPPSAQASRLLDAMVYDLRDPDTVSQAPWGVHELEIYAATASAHDSTSTEPGANQ